jgi:DNA-binding PadR family transcriptional regulator
LRYIVTDRKAVDETVDRSRKKTPMHAMTFPLSPPQPHPWFARRFGPCGGAGDPARAEHDDGPDHRHDHDHDHDHGHRDHPGHLGHLGPLWLAMTGRRGGPGSGPGPEGGRGRGHGLGHGHGPFGGPFGGFGGPFGGFGGGRGRARRGDIRAAILRLLAEVPMHGYQIIQELSARTGGAWNPSPGSIYPTLQALEDKGLIRADDVEGKRVFQLTDAGRAEVERDREHNAAPWDDVAASSGGFADLREVTLGVVGAARQVAQAGTPGQLQRAVTVLKDARRKLYQLLAEDPEAEPEGGAPPA